MTDMKKLNLQALTESRMATHYDCLAIINSLSDVQATPITDVMVEGFLLAFVLKGQAEMIVESKQCDLREGDFFVCNPRNILERSMLSTDFEIRGIFVEPEYAEHIASEMSLDWTFRRMAQTHEVMHCSAEDLAVLTAYTDLLNTMVQREDTTLKRNAIDSLMKSMAYELLNIRQRMGVQEALPTQRYSSAEYLFQRFVKMLSAPGTPFMSVADYAERLNITPKYFSVICKSLTGKTASTIINEEVIRSAKIMLHDNSKSVKQVADELGFVNQSHFGAFFRRYTGTSPQKFRKS